MSAGREIIVPSSKSKQSVKFVDIFQTEWCDIYHTIIGEACHQCASLSTIVE